MASAKSKLINLLLSIINKKRFLRKQFASGRSGLFSCPKPPSKIKRSCHVHEFQINNRNVFTLRPKNKKENGKHILYLHGGAYVQTFVIFHWEFLAELVNKTGCIVTAPDYPLAPDHTYKESFTLASVLYHQLIAAEDNRHLILMGDSSGGGFALALAQKLKQEHVVQPCQIILLSPWLDITLSNPGIHEVNGFEPFLGIEGLRQAGKKYAGDESPDHYLLSPIYGSFEGLGKISVFIGTKDILAADTRKLKALADQKEIDINYQEYENMFHGWMFLNIPESKKVKEEIIGLIT